MNTLDYIKFDPVVNEMYRKESLSIYLDTLTPAQIVYLANDPVMFDKWVDKVNDTIKKAVNAQINKALHIEPRSWGKILTRPEQKTKTIPEPVFSVQIPYNYKGVCICVNG